MLRPATHRRPTPRGFCLGLLAALLLIVRSAPAEPPPSKPAPAAPAEVAAGDAKTLANERFQRGVTLANQGNCAAALGEFRETLRLFPSWSATYRAADCLKKLGRFDESLDTFAAMLRDFADKIREPFKERALREVEELRKLVGTIEIDGSEPGAAIVVDQQSRGDYPLLAPLRVPAGSYIVRVYKEGYEPFETRADVAGGTTKRVTAPLRKLKQTGTLQVAETLGRELEVVVDGIGVGKTGKTPLNLPLAPGKHMVLLRGEGNLGTAPATVIVRVNEVSPLRIEAEVLNASLRVMPTPFDALVSIDSVIVGRGRWDGRVRPGGHKIEIAAEGFLPETRKVLIRNDKSAVVAVELSRDPNSPFWRAPPPPPHFVAELRAGLTLLPSFGGDVAGGCAGQCALGVGVGTARELRGGYVLSSGLGFGAVLGYVNASQSITGREASLNIGPAPDGDVQARMDDDLALSGFLAGAWVEGSFATRFPIHLRLSAGALFGKTSDARHGVTVSGAAPGSPIGGLNQSASALLLFVAPEVQAGLRLRPGVELYAGLAVPILWSPKPPRWNREQGFDARPDGYGSFNDDAWLGNVIVSFTPGVGTRFDF